jgi:hypothetical protein
MVLLLFAFLANSELTISNSFKSLFLTIIRTNMDLLFTLLQATEVVSDTGWLMPVVLLVLV